MGKGDSHRQHQSGVILNACALHHRDAFGVEQLGDEILVGRDLFPDGAVRPIVPSHDG